MIDKYKCGCVIAGDKLGIITWSKCAIHSKAPAMYEALKGLNREQSYGYCFCGVAIDNPNYHGKHSNSCLAAASALEGL